MDGTVPSVQRVVQGPTLSTLDGGPPPSCE